MAKRLTILLLGVAILIATSMGAEIWQTTKGMPPRWKRWRDGQEAKKPPRKLALRPDDYRKYPREGFGFAIEWDRGFNIDTLHGTLTKDLIENPDTTIAFELSPAEMGSIYEATIAMRFFDLPEPHPPFESHYWSIPYDDSVKVEVRSGSAVKHLAWSTRHVIEHPSDDWKRLNRWLSMIGRMVERNPGDLALPMARGGYD